ncbi:MAG: immunoglobulin domain-containing protein [Phycisphaeraceae bacterium]|nr:immunoglobulin domain-containing protein [Phycisphaeraceae bacterium]
MFDLGEFRVMSRVLFTVVLLLIYAIAVRARAQCAEGWFPGGGLPGTDGGVEAFVVIPGGDVIVGGGFTTVGSLMANSIARYNPTTGEWSALSSGLMSTDGRSPRVDALAVLPDGDVIVGGFFTSAGGVEAKNIARYNPTSGTWSSLGSGTDYSVYALAVLPGGEMIAGGRFNTAGGVGASRIARYNPNTGVWSAMGEGVTINLPHYTAEVWSLAVLSDGDVIVGGLFTTAGGVAAKNIARYNPSTGEWSALASGTEGGGVRALAVLPGGDVVVGGQFWAAGGADVRNIARYNPATGVWSALDPILNSDVYALLVLPGGDVLVAGDYGGSIALFDPATGSGQILDTGMNDFASALAMMPEGEVIAGGGFTTAGERVAFSLARWNLFSGGWSPLVDITGVDDQVDALAVLPDGDVIASGWFTTAGGVEANSVARYNPTTGIWSALGSGIARRWDVETLAIAPLPNGDVILGGRFSVAGGVAANNIARYSPATGVWSAMGSGVVGSVYSFAVLPGGDVLVGGGFTTAGGIAANGIARYNTDTGVWSALGSGVNGAIFALAVLPGGDVVVSGSFSTAGGIPASNIARYNPSTGVWSALGSGIVGNQYWTCARALTVLPGGEVIVGGYFTTAGGIPAGNIARYNPMTDTWSAMGSGTNGVVNALAVIPNGDVIVGGLFRTAGETTASDIARYSPGTGTWSALGSGITSGGPLYYDEVIALAVLPDGDVIAGGAFTTAGGFPSAYFARYTFGEPAPSITSQPQHTIGCPAGYAAFSVVVQSNDPLAYQWRKNGDSIDTWDNPTASTSTLMLMNLLVSDAGTYDCVVTDGCGSIVSDAAILTICIGDFNCDGGIDGTDVESFFAEWEAGSEGADVNGDATVDGADIDMFFVRWEGGC